MKKSEFGKGFIYNLILFAKHYERFREDIRINNKMAETSDLWKPDESTLWFNGAGDHFFELEIPKQFIGTEIERIALELKNESLARRFGKTTIDDFNAFFTKLEELCIMIDKEFKIKPIKAQWN